MNDSTSVALRSFTALLSSVIESNMKGLGASPHHAVGYQCVSASWWNYLLNGVLGRKILSIIRSMLGWVLIHMKREIQEKRH